MPFLCHRAPPRIFCRVSVGKGIAALGKAE